MRAESSIVGRTRHRADCTGSASPSSMRFRPAPRSRLCAAKRFTARYLPRGLPVSKLEIIGKAPNRRGTKVRFQPDPEIFGANAKFDPARLFRMTRAKAYLFGGVEIRWRCAASLVDAEGKVPAEAVFPLPRRTQGLSGSGNRGSGDGRRSALHRQSGKAGKAWLGRMGARLARGRGRFRPFVLATRSRPPTAARTRRGCASRCSVR